MKRLIAVLLAIAFLGTAGMASAEDMLQIKGSDTLINMVQKLAEVYMQKNPGKAIAVTGGGSGTGIAALLNGQCDIADASRAMKGKEYKKAEAAGIDVREIVVANDGICVIVNGGNNVQALTMDQLGKIFRGDIKNWKEVGGKDMTITLYGRQPNSGTYSYFKKAVLKAEYYDRMRQMNGNAQITEGIKQDKSGIGYVGVGYARSAQGVAVVKVAKTAEGPYVSPLNDADVKAGKYAISRALYQYVNGVPSGAIRDFIAFELSAEGQKIVEGEGFFPVNAGDVANNKKNANL